MFRGCPSAEGYTRPTKAIRQRAACGIPSAVGLFSARRGQARRSAEQKTTATAGTIAVESERIAWGEMDAPYRENATDPKRLHVDERFFCTRFGSGEPPLPAPSGSRGGNVGPVPPF